MEIKEITDKPDGFWPEEILGHEDASIGRVASVSEDELHYEGELVLMIRIVG